MKIPKPDFTAKTPKWAKRMQKLSVALSAAAAVLWATDLETLPSWSHDLAGYIFIGGLLLGAFAQGFKEGGNNE